MRLGRKKRLSSSPVSLGIGVLPYLALLAASYILAMLAGTPLTYALFLFTVSFPLLSIVCLCASFLMIFASSDKSEATVTRFGRVNYSLKIVNSGFLPVSKLTCLIGLPYTDGNSGIEYVKKSIALPPFSSLSLDSTLYLPRRGFFPVGARCVYLYDFLHVIKVRKKIDGILEVSVLPAASKRGGSFLSTNDEGSTPLAEDQSSHDQIGVREYRAGDSMKIIHWKLSSKSDELKTKRFTSSDKNHLTVICDNRTDLGNYGLSPAQKNELGDRTIEEALSVILDIPAEDRVGEMIIYGDNRKALSIPFDEDEEELLRRLTVIGDGESDNLSSLIEQEASQVVYCLSYLYDNQATDLIEAAEKAGSTRFSATVFSAEALLAEGQRSKYLISAERFCNTLQSCGIKVTLIRREAENERSE